MGKREEYREKLLTFSNWDAYLLAESGLPGPRGNLELADAVADEGDEALFRRYASINPVESQTGMAEEFLVFCGVLGYGRLLADGQTEYLKDLQYFANDPRWRIREAVARGLQRVGDVNIDTLLSDVEPWAHGSLLEMRAAAAACCEPRLLVNRQVAIRVLKLLDEITEKFVKQPERKSENARVLRQVLAYCWSVAAAASPQEGFEYMESWLAKSDPDVIWLMRENLKKNRLVRVDSERVERLSRMIKAR